MRTGFLLATISIFLGLWSSSAEATVYVNRVPNQNPPYYTIQAATISADATWSAANSPYIVEATVTVNNGVTLTVESGTTVQVTANVGIYISGTLAATSATFTRNGAGYWKGIYLGPGAGASVLTNSTISYAGTPHLGYINGNDRDTSLYVDNCNPQITGCIISNSQTNGIELYSSTATIQNSTFTDMGASNYPIVFDTTDTFPVMSGNSTSGNGYNGIGLPAGSITVSGAWNLPGSNFPYLMNGQLNVTEGVTLTVAAGNTVKSSWDAIYVSGTLSAVGTSGLPINFTSRAASPAAGNWKGIYLAPTAGSSALSHVTINYAGALHLGYFNGNDRDASLYLDQISPPLANLSILNSASNGLELYAASPAITTGNFQGCSRNGLRGENGSRPTINTATINNNGSGGFFAVSLDASSVPDPTGVTFSGNTKQGIEVRGGTLSANGTWKNWSANAPYAVTGNMIVAAGVNLTINPTTTIKLWTAYLYVYGTLIANSTTGRITFTSLADDSVGGDTNGNGSASLPAAGNWRGIYLSPASGASVLNNCTISYAGALHLGYFNGYDRDTSLYVDSCNPVITGCTISDSATNGVELYASQATIQNTAFSNMGVSNYPVVFDTTDTFPVTSGNSTSGTGYNGVGLAAGNITVSGTWNRPGANFPYLMTGSLSLISGNTLTIDPGVTVKASGTSLYISGTLTALGTGALPITFSSRAASPAAGNWKGIYLAPTAGASAMSYVTINYAGAIHLGYFNGNDQDASLYLDQISPPLANLSILNSATNGLELYAASPAISSGHFENCGSNALRGENGSRPVITGITFNANGLNGSGFYTISIDAGSVPNPTDATFSGNKKQGIEVRGGNLGTSATWKNWSANAPYALTGDMTVDATRTLAIERGSSVKAWGSGLYVYGTLTANGSSGRIIFTSLADDSVGGDTNGDGNVSSPAAGNWKGIYLAPTAGASVMSYVTLNYAGALHLGYINGNDRDTSLYLDQISPSLTNLSILNSATNGLELYGASPAITNSRFESCGRTQLNATASSHPSVSGTRFIGSSGAYGFTTATPSLLISAHNNFWGAVSGPYDPSDDRSSGGLYNPGGNGVRVSDGIDYGSYRTSADVVLTITFAGTGAGSVTSTPGDASCTGTSTFSKPEGTSYSLLATGDQDSLFSAWSGACTGFGDCDVILYEDTSLGVNFSFVKPARIQGATPLDFNTIAAAYQAAGGGALLQLRDYLFAENVLLNRQVTIMMVGGYDKTYTTDNGLSQINGVVTVGYGSVTLENILIK